MNWSIASKVGLIIQYFKGACIVIDILKEEIPAQFNMYIFWKLVEQCFGYIDNIGTVAHDKPWHFVPYIRGRTWWWFFRFDFVHPLFTPWIYILKPMDFSEKYKYILYKGVYDFMFSPPTTPISDIIADEVYSWPWRPLQVLVGRRRRRRLTNTWQDLHGHE